MATGTAGSSGATVVVNSQASAEQAINGGAGSSPEGHISNELRNLVTLLGAQSGNGITLEQLLSVTSTSNSRPPKPSPSTPISHSQSPVLPSTPNSSSIGISSEGLASRKRGLTFDTDVNPKRRRSSNYSSRQSGERPQNKGLRHFSQRVCEKVRDKGTTTYNEVADELVKELTESEKKSHGSAQMPIDQKNIRRRVYDALNVLMAMNIISKEKKEIRWIGLPTNSAQECQHIEEELAQAQQRLQTKRDEVENLLVQILSFKNLMKRNRERVSSLGTPAQNSAIGLPFIIVNTNKKTTIDCSISSDKSEYVFNFDNAFELHNDIDVLKKMGLDCGLHSGTYTEEDVKTAKSMLPKALGNTLEELTGRNHKAPGTPQTPIQVSTPVASAVMTSSTPNPSMLTPLGGQGSPLTDATIAAALAQMKHGNSLMQISSQAVVPGLNASPVPSLSSPVPSVTVITPSNTPTTPVHSGTASPQTLSGLSVSGRSPLPPLAIRQATSPMSVAKTILHSHCPSTQQGARSPLLKVAANPVQAGSSVSSSSSSISTSGTAHPAQTSKSPGRKIVTVSKLPTSEQISVILQQLQNSPQTATVELSKLITSASSSLNTTSQLLNGGGSHGTSSNGNTGQPTSTRAGLLTNLTGGASVGKKSQSYLVSNGQ